MLVKEVRIQAEVCSSSVICRTDKGTSLICIADRSTVRHAVLYVSVYAYVMIMADCSSENEILIVYILLTETLLDHCIVKRISLLSKCLCNELAEFGRSHHRKPLRVLLNTHAAAVRHLRLVALTLLGGDHDDTVGSSRTIDGGCRSILEDIHGLDVRWVDGRKRVACLVVCSRIDHDSVDDEDRLVCGIEGVDTSDAD